MATVERRTKYLAENRVYTMDFAAFPEVAAGETLSSPAVTATPTTTPALTLAAPTVSGSRVQVRISAGLNGSTYTLNFQVATSGGSTLQDFAILVVQNPV